MLNNHTRVRKGSFTENDVTGRHFVTTDPTCGQAPGSPDRLEPVTRRFHPEPAALEQLIDVLRELLVDASANEPQAAQRTCVSAAPE
jgi:hypothetical protein